MGRNMGANTKIEWCDFTFNCWRGCQKVAPGCANCYAESQSRRNPGVLGIWGPGGTRVVASESMWREPVKWNRVSQDDLSSYEAGAWEDLAAGYHGPPGDPPQRRRVFCGSMMDWAEDWSSFVRDSKGEEVFENAGGTWSTKSGEQHGKSIGLADVRQRLFGLIDSTPHLDWLLLTKRPENIRRMWPGLPSHVIEEIRLPIPGFPHYEVSNFGVVYSRTGASRCGNCGTTIEGQLRKKYCSGACRCAAYNRAKHGGQRDIYPTEAKPLSQDIGEQGHRRVTIYDGQGKSQRVLVHRLVLSIFDRPALPDMQCRHLDGNSSNNRLDNLAWGDQSSNWGDSKRHGTHRRYSKLSEEQVDEIRTKAREGDTFSALAIQYNVSATQISNIINYRQWATGSPPLAFRNNCWIGTSIACQADAVRNIPLLLKCRDLSPVLFLLIEPPIGPVDLRGIGFNGFTLDCLTSTCCPWHPSACNRSGCNGVKVDWVIVGGESGPNARPCQVEWIRSIVQQCREAGVPCFVKQLGANVVTRNDMIEDAFNGKDGWPDPQVEHHIHGFREDYQGADCRVRLRDPKGGDPSEWPEDLRVREFPVVNVRASKVGEVESSGTETANGNHEVTT